jgi:hypothetical protein
MSVLVCHPKDIEEAELVVLVASVKASSLVQPDEPIVTARDSFLEFEKKHGKPVNWKRWFDHITGSLTTFGTEPRFRLFVIGPTSMVGKATKDIVGEALRKNRPVFRMKPGGAFTKATKVVVLDPENYKHGWVVA